MTYRIGNLGALADLLRAQARLEGNESEHELGISLVNLARERGLTEEQIIDALGGRYALAVRDYIQGQPSEGFLAMKALGDRVAELISEDQA